MREHEVPTHVQAEDKALLWFTFPQIVAVVATCAVAYGVYRYFPFGPSGLKLGIAILLGITGIAMTVGKVGGRGLPLVAADLLKFNLGARRYAGCPAELAISEPPPQPEAKPDPLRLLAKKAAGKVGNAVKAARQKGRRPFRPHSWFGKGRRRRDAGDQQFRPQESKQEKPPRPARGRLWGRFLSLAALGLLAVVLLPGSALADDPDDNPYGDAWRLGEIYFEPPDPVPGRRVYVERLSVSGDTAAVTLRAAHDLDLKGRVFGGRTGRTLKMGFNTSLAAGAEQELQPDPGRPVALLHLLLAGRPGVLRRGVAEEPSNSLPPAHRRGGAVRPGGHLPGVDAGADRRRHRLGVHHGDPARGGPAGVRRPLQPVGPGPAGRHRHRHHGHGQRHVGRPLHHGGLRPGRRDRLHPARGQQPGGQRAGDHGGPDGHAERPPAAHVADRPPPGPHRRVHPPGDLHLR